MPAAIRLDIFIDPVCPWCLIGKTHLDRALESRPDHPFQIQWHPFQLNPDMPKEGVGHVDYLAEKFGAFLPAGGEARAACLSWLFWQMGSAPYLGGGFGHFYAYAPEKFEYPINRYAMETKRQLDVLNRHLSTRTYMAGDDYTIADIAIYPWYGWMVEGKLYNAGEFLSVHEYPHVQRWAKAIGERPAVQRGRRINRGWGDEAGQVPERH